MNATAVHEASRIKFSATKRGDFYPVVKERVEAYFSKEDIVRTGGPALWWKTAGILFLYAGTYACLLINWGSFAATLAFFILLGIEAALIGFNVIHDALHGAYSPSHRINRMIGYIFDFNGMSSMMWMVTHNVQHHTYTNITGLDKDIDKLIWLRLSPHDEYYWFHRYQHLYALPLYCLSSINWCHYADYKQFWLTWKEKKVTFKDAVLFFGFKALNWIVFFVMPMLFLSIPWWQIVIGYLAMHASGAFVSAIVFQLAHVVEGVEYPLPDGDGHMHNRWAEHEVRTSSSFGTRDLWLTHFVGGLNFQIEHHLFPGVCHTHYPAIAPIVRATVLEFGLPYCEHATFRGAIASHLRTLRHLGQNPSNSHS